MTGDVIMFGTNWLVVSALIALCILLYLRLTKGPDRNTEAGLNTRLDGSGFSASDMETSVALYNSALESEAHHSPMDESSVSDDTSGFDGIGDHHS